MDRKKTIYFQKYLAFLIILALMLPTIISNAATPEFQKFDSFPDQINYEQIRTPYDMAFDRDGNKYVVDSNAVIKYDASDNYMLHWKGELSSPIAIAIDEANRIYVAEQSKVFVFDHNGTLLSSFGQTGSGSSQFNRISDIVVDDLYIYIADSDNHRVQIFDRTDNSYITQLGEFGTGDGQFRTPIAIDVDDDHHLYVVDRQNHRIQLFEYSSGPSWTWGSKQGQYGSDRLEFDDPVNIFVEQIDATNTMMHVYDISQQRIQRIPVKNHDISVIYFAIVGTTDIVDDGIKINSDSRVIRDPFSGQFYIINGEIIARVDNPQNMSNWIGLSVDQFHTAEGLAVDHLGNYYIADYTQHRMLKYDHNGKFLLSWGTLGTFDGQFMHPMGVAIDSTDHVYVVDHFNYRVQKFTSDGTFVTSWHYHGTGFGELHLTYGIAIDDNDDVYVSSNKSVQKFTSDGAFITQWGNSVCDLPSEESCKKTGNFNNPRGIAVDAAGDVYVADRGNHRVQKFSPDGTFIEAWGKADAAGGDGRAEFLLPSWIAVDHENRIHVADFFNNRIQVLTIDGDYINEYGDYPDTNYLSAMAVNTDGNMAIIDNIQWKVNLFRETQPITDLTAIGGDQSVTLHFTAPTGARQIDVRQSVYGTDSWSDATISGSLDETSTSIVVSELADDTTYSFYLNVFGGVHEGVSNTTVSTTNAAPIIPPVDPDPPKDPDPPMDPDPPVDPDPSDSDPPNDLSSGSPNFIPNDPSRDDSEQDDSKQTDDSSTDDHIDFTDIAGHWAEDIIRGAAKDGIITGYTNKTFQPNRHVSRAEFVAFIAQIKGWASESTLPLPYNDHLDIPKWAQGYIAQATQENIVYGYGDDGTFKADQTITRAEAVAILMRELNEPPHSQMDPPFQDDEWIPAWAKGNVYAAANLGLIVGRGNHYFQPNEPVTRAESLVLLIHMR